MGNCTSKKSAKVLKLNLSKKSILIKKMDKDQETTSKGLSKKIAPFTKGEATSFGFKKKPTSSLPTPVTLTSNGYGFHDNDDKRVQNGILKNKELIDDYQSGSSVESLCHAPLRSTPKMIRKKDLLRQSLGNNNNNLGGTGTDNISTSNMNNNINNNQSTNVSTCINNINNNDINNEASQNEGVKGVNSSVNRFGFRQQSSSTTTTTTTSKLTTEVSVKSVKYSNNTHVVLNNQGPYDTGTFKVNKKTEISTRSRSEGPREAFFKQNLQPASSVHSGLNQPRATFTANVLQPGKFTLQTSHLPRPQFPVRMPDTKRAKTVTNYYRRGGAQSDSNSSKEGSLNEDSGFESHSSGKHSEKMESSPGYSVRRRLPVNGKKLEMKIVGNKFELLKKDEENDPTVVTEVSLIKLPTSGIRTSTTVINTGLVEQRTNQYLKRISQNTTKEGKNFIKDSNKIRSNSRHRDNSSNRRGDEGRGGESEEEKLFKDSKKSEKSGTYLMSEGGGEADDMLPGEAMAEGDVSLSLSSDDETSGVEVLPKPQPRQTVNLQTEITPNSIRLDALKLSKQLKCKNQSISEITPPNIHLKMEDSSFGPLASCEPDEETFPSDSILEQLSSDSDSLGDKGEDKDNDKEKNLKNADVDVETEDLEIDLEDVKDEELREEIEIEDLELNADEKEENAEVPNNALEAQTPETPGTPTNASNSLSLSEGRDFLIDDEIADQPQLCFTETYPDCSCQEDVKTCNDKTLTSSGNNNEFLSCSDVTSTKVIDDETRVVDKNEGVAEDAEAENAAPKIPSPKTKRTNSVGTLSPCESLTSDDLMMDFESSVCDESVERFNSGDDNVSVDNVDVSVNGEEILKEWSAISSQKNNAGMGTGKLLKSGSGSSTPGSPRSLDPRNVSSPMRSCSSRQSTADEDSVKIDKISYQHMFQDIVSIKTMLLKLKRVLSESEGNLHENGLKLHPDEKHSENGLSEEMADLRKQVIFLQQQLEEREKLVQNLQSEINKTECNKTGESKEQCNAATQTDKIRPNSTGPSIVQNLPSDSGSLISNNLTNSIRRKEIVQDGNKGIIRTTAAATPQMDKIMEKVKELSFKPVDVLEKEESDPQLLPKCKFKTNGFYNGNSEAILKESDVNRKSSKNVFKITKIDLVLKSDNYGKSEINRSNR